MPDNPDAATLAPLTLWLTDRSRSETGLGRCPRRRYLGSHFGPTGYGITAHGESLPLATGLSVHDGMAAFATILQRENRLPTAEETRAIAQTVQAAYRAKVEARGYLGILAGPITNETIAEQTCLIGGLLWALRLNFLPWLHETYRLLSIEEERLHFLDCACGAGPLDAAEHIRRGCQGIALMLRRDLLAERRAGGSLAYFEIKTTSWDSDAWAEQWETKPQLALGTLDADRQFGKDVTELYVVAVGKGARRKDRYDGEGTPDPLDPANRKKQLSPLCYGYCRPANPPLTVDDWLPAYSWVTETGETKRASRSHRRRGVWELPQSDWPTWRAFHEQDPAMPPEEFWIRTLPPSLLDKVVFVLGPMNRQDAQLVSLRESMRADEQAWQAILWELYEAQQQHAWASPEFQARLDRLVPCAWTCRPYGKEHQCEFVPICHRYAGWDDPLGSGKYVPRRPHHAPELQQAVARGLLIEQAEDAVDEEERD